MRLLHLLPALLAPLALAQTQNFNKYQNPFTIPRSGFSFTAGKASDINWTPTTNGTVSIMLRSGPSSNFEYGEMVASHIPNSGTYTWTPSTSITLGLNYVLEIVNDANLDQTNYSPYFVLNSPNTVVSSTALLTYAAETTGVQTLTSAFPTEVVTGEVGGTETSVGPAASVTATGGVPGGGSKSSGSATGSVTGSASASGSSSGSADSTVSATTSASASAGSSVSPSVSSSLAGFVATTTSSKAGASVPTGVSGKRVAAVVAAAVGMAWGV
ncbi:hypothetical protein AOQ84DRAFT_69090 [Glonium stellatum]|uniref:Yeast cell wall synthesis Kre9/Knh1-like N-terminal domain-containing protein n=1 Tax=Glonium stellatum TaxID=574774 RepID=A0A8E2EYV1_9PEZI|nr:hypothetical protein AOQ84DRAFT_69090 [Glonium stellatum]